MTTSRYPEITDELLSAYIDNAVSAGERALIEQAVGEDATIAWRLATLHETVHLLRTLPVLQAPRTFVLTAEQAGQPLREPAFVPGVIAAGDRALPDQRRSAPSQPRRWSEFVERWGRFWQAGSPIWRNAMATSMALLFVLVLVPTYLSGMQQQEMSVVKTAADPNAGFFAEAPSVAQGEPATVMLEPEARPMQDALDAASAALLKAPSLDTVGEAAPAVAQAPTDLPAVVMESSSVETTESSEREPGGTAAPQPFELMERPAARVMTPADRYEDPLSFAPGGGESAMPGYEAPVGNAAAPDRGALPFAPPMLEYDEQRSAAVSAAAASEAPDVAAAALEDAAPVADPSVTDPSVTDLGAAAFSEEDSSTSEADAAVTASTPAPAAFATAAYDENAAHVATDSSQPAQPDGVAPGEMPAPLAGVTTSLLPGQLLPWLQLSLAGAALAFGLLWWRSRRNL